MWTVDVPLIILRHLSELCNVCPPVCLTSLPSLPNFQLKLNCSLEKVTEVGCTVAHQEVICDK